MPIFGTLFTLPDASTTLSNLGAYSTPVASDFMPLFYLLGGIALAILIVVVIVKIFADMAQKK